MTERARRPTAADLPVGYQFGDAAQPQIAIRYVQQFDIIVDSHPTRFPCEVPPHWNVIEGEHE